MLMMSKWGSRRLCNAWMSFIGSFLLVFNHEVFKLFVVHFSIKIFIILFIDPINLCVARVIKSSGEIFLLNKPILIKIKSIECCNSGVYFLANLIHLRDFSPAFGRDFSFLKIVLPQRVQKAEIPISPESSARENISPISFGSTLTLFLSVISNI